MKTIIAGHGHWIFQNILVALILRDADPSVKVAVSSIPETLVRRLALGGRFLMLGSSPMQGGRHT